jgi:hypothetical protein
VARASSIPPTAKPAFPDADRAGNGRPLPEEFHTMTAEVAVFRTREEVIAEARAEGVLRVHDSTAARGLALALEVTRIGTVARGLDFRAVKEKANIYDLLLRAFASNHEDLDVVERVRIAARASLGDAMEEFGGIESGAALPPWRAQRVLELLWQAEKQVGLLEEFAASFFAVARVAAAAAEAGLVDVQASGIWVEPLTHPCGRGLPMDAYGPAWLRDARAANGDPGATS